MTKLLLAATASLAALTLAAPAQAQSGDWSGGYVSVFAGYADRSEKAGETIRFDTNLDGVFGDTVRTAAGADAFSTGFCGGSYITNAAPGGCRPDDDNDVEVGIRGGYDFQIGDFVIGGLIEYSQLELSDAVTAFSITPAGYTMTRKLKDLLAFRARGGYAFGDNLVYATGGFAQGNITNRFNTTNTVNAFPFRGGGDSDGYQFGFGYERRIWSNMTLGVEWIRTKLDDDEHRVRSANSGTTAATNPFLLVNTQGTDFARSNGDFEFDNIRVTASWRF